MRVVTEAVASGRLLLPLPVPYAFGNQRLRVVGMAHQNQHANVIHGTVGLSGQISAQFVVVGRIGARFCSGIARGEYARRAV